MIINSNIIMFVFLCVCGVDCQLNLPEGSACTVNGVNGTCVRVIQCYSAALTTLFTKSGYTGSYAPPLPEICSYTDTNEPIYCCTDCKLDTNQTLLNYVVLPDAELRQRIKSIAWNKCAEYFQTLPYSCRGNARYGYTLYMRYHNATGNCHDITDITKYYSLGGYDAKRWQLPHMALLGFGAVQESVQWLCGGSVISERFILTAAHCSSYPKLGSLTYAAMGILKRSDPSEYWKVYKIKRIIVHPEYKSPSKYSDIALLETETEINFGRGLLPACLDVPDSHNYDIPVIAPGWGRLGPTNAVADTLQILELREFKEDQCAAIFPEYRLLKQGYNHTTQMCCGSTLESKVADTCEGDSGGPLQRSRDCMHTVFGVTSYGKECGTIGSAGMYTRVRHYVPWIESVVWPELYKDYYN